MGIAIAFLGLYGLVAFYAQMRKKEIGIRQVLGASTATIAMLVTRQFVSLVITSRNDRDPPGLDGHGQVAAGFRLPHSSRVFPFLPSPFISAFLIAMAAVLLQTLRAARDNPVNSLCGLPWKLKRVKISA